MLVFGWWEVLERGVGVVACPDAVLDFSFVGWFFVVFWLGVLWGVPPAEGVFVQVVKISPGFEKVFVLVEVVCNFPWRVAD